MDIKSFQVASGQLFVAVIAFMLHAGSLSNHSEIVGIHNGVDVAGETQGKRRQRNVLGKPLSAVALPLIFMVGPPDG